MLMAQGAAPQVPPSPKTPVINPQPPAPVLQQDPPVRPQFQDGRPRHPGINPPKQPPAAQQGTEESPSTPSVQGTAAGAQQPSVQTPPPPAGRRPAAAGGMVSLNFDDADVFSVIQTIFGDILRVNYIVDPRVKGRVTFRSIAPINRDQVLSVMEVILRINGIGVVEDGGLYRVVPLNEVSREPSSVSFGRDADKIPATGKSMIQVVPVLYLQSTEVVKLITPFLSANAVVLDVPKSNQLIIVDTDASVRRVLQLIETFDNEKQKKKRAQVFVYPVQNGKAKDISALLQQIFLGARSTATPTATTRPLTTTTPGQSGPAPTLPSPPVAMPHTSTTAGPQAPGTLVSDITKIFSDDIINSVIVLATPEDYETIKETIAKIDIIPRQVVIEGVIASVNLTDNLSLGLAYSLNLKVTFNSGQSLTGGIGLNPDTLNKITPGTLSGSGFSYSGVDDKGAVRAYINALATDNRAKLLAAPHILVSDNREARIQVGDQVPIVTSETFGSGTVAPQRTIQYKDIGIILKAKPQVNESGLVSLDISQEVSTYETIQLFANETQIILHKTEASTNLVVQDGQTIIIGGLIREDSSTSRTGVPFLQSIPILGYLFGNTDRKKQRNEIIILLTPHVIKNQREAKSVTSEFVDKMTMGEMGKAGLKRSELIRSDNPQGRQDKGNEPETATPSPAQPDGSVAPSK
jgi:general secretion pathway protein D